jgi:ribosomal protein L16 Arg81 hydroxylase
VNAYLSTGDSGFARHFDARNVTTLQLAGNKRWIYSSQPAVMVPQRNAALRATGPVYAGSPPADWEAFSEEPGARDEQEVILEPGHVLTLPAGTWHAARASGYSLAINVYFRHESFTAVVNRFLEQTLAPNPQWRGGVPAFPRGQLEGELRGYLKDRIQEMAALLESLASDPGPLLDFVYAALSTASSQANPPPPAAEPLAKTDLLRVRRPDLLWTRPYDGPGGRRLAVYHDGEVFQMDAGVEDFMLQLCAQRLPFRADSCCDWTNDDSAYPWDDVKALLESLFVRGIVVRDDRAADAVR